MVTARAPRPHDATADLFARIHRPDASPLARDVGRDMIVRANMGLVVSIAKRYTGRGHDFEDLVQNGSIGLLKAIDKFDLGRGVRFSTYATHWIRHEIIRSLENTGRTIRLPSHFSALHARVGVVAARWQAEHGRAPTVEEIAWSTGASLKKIRAVAANYVDTPESLDEHDEFDRPLVERIAATESNDDISG